MSLLKNLQEKSKNGFYQKIDFFVENLIPEFEKSAEKGYRKFDVRMDNDQSEFALVLYNHPDFVNELKKRLPGFEIEIVEEPYMYVLKSPLGQQTILRFTW